MTTDRWDGNVHYYEYTPSTIERYPGMDAFKVAEGYLYAQPDSAVALGIVVVVSAQDLGAGVTKDRAIQQGRQVVRKHLTATSGLAESAKGLRQSETYLFTWSELSLGRVVPPPDRPESAR